MKKYLVTVAVALTVLFGGAVALTSPASAVDVYGGNCSGDPICAETQGGGNAANGFIQNIISTLLVVIGIIAVIMIIIGGIRYTTSDGDSNRISQAKNTILYSIVGLIVAMVSFAIVQFVIAQF